MISLILIALILWNNTSTHMSLHSDTSSWFRAIQSLILFINPVGLVKKQKYKLDNLWFDLTWTRTHYLQDSRWACYLLHHLTWPDLDSNPLSTRLQGEHAIHYITWPDLTWTRTHYLQDSRWACYPLHHLTWPGFEPTIYKTQGEHGIHYITNADKNVAIIFAQSHGHYLRNKYSIQFKGNLILFIYKNWEREITCKYFSLNISGWLG
jgi:hypothetical protein